MAIVPRKKRSISKKNIRHASRQRDILKKLTNMLALATCANCGETKQSHRVCHSCGFYRGKQIITIKAPKASASTPDVIDA